MNFCEFLKFKFEVTISFEAKMVRYLLTSRLYCIWADATLFRCKFICSNYSDIEFHTLLQKMKFAHVLFYQKDI